MMRPPGASPSLDSKSANSCQIIGIQPRHQCENPNCDRWVEGHRFCCAKCREGATASARQALTRLRRYLRTSRSSETLSARVDASLAVPLGEFLESLPDSASRRFDVLWLEMDALDSIITTKGPMDVQTRRDLRTRAALVAAVASLEYPESGWASDYQLVAARAHELLRDVPVEGPLTPRSIPMPLGNAEAAVAYFLAVKNYPNLGRSLLSLANLYRVIGRSRDAKKIFRWAFHVLNERTRPDNPTIATLLHEALDWKLRTVGCDMEPDAIQEAIKRLTELAERADDARRWVTHFRDLAGFARYLFDEPASIHQAEERLVAKRRELAEHNAFGDPTLATPFIEFNFGNKHVAKSYRDEAVRLVLEEYVPAYRIVPNFYNYAKIMKWSKRHGFTVDVPPPQHDGAFLSFLPRFSQPL
jgi:tetratricopeptide (TPR) repeat protein